MHEILRRLMALLCLACWTLSASAQSPSAASPGAPWQQTLAVDLAFIRQTLDSRHIYAVYPGGAEWRAVHDPAMQRADDAVESVRDFAGYRAVLLRLAADFRDPHLRLNLNLQSARYQWPGWIAQRRDGRYRVKASRSTDPNDGAELSACDGRPIEQWVDELTALEGGVPDRESTRVAFAMRLLLDVGNPFWRRPQTCRIGDNDVVLNWTPISAEAWGAAAAREAIAITVPIGLSDFGTSGAWIRLPTMSPRSQADADRYHDVIRSAPRLRDRGVIVFDVRGNGGGAYNWFVAMLRSLYGDGYASHFARERLRIRPVFVTEAFTPGTGAADPFNTPEDDDLQHVIDSANTLTLGSGRRITVLDARDERRRRSSQRKAPANPVRARVFVLTDHGCASACLSFVDEMLQFPGVLQIGAETMFDRRSGTALPYPLPSGNGTLLAPSMVREHRARGENVPWTPTYRFSGDIADTDAVQRWIQHDIMQAITSEQSR